MHKYISAVILLRSVSSNYLFNIKLKCLHVKSNIDKRCDMNKKAKQNLPELSLQSIYAFINLSTQSSFNISISGLYYNIICNIYYLRSKICNDL